VVGAESHKVGLVIHLKMRKLPAIEGLRHEGKTMWGQPPSAVRGSEAPLCMVGQSAVEFILVQEKC
jgi:hypothetical protein